MTKLVPINVMPELKRILESYQRINGFKRINDVIEYLLEKNEEFNEFKKSLNQIIPLNSEKDLEQNHSPQTKPLKCHPCNNTGNSFSRRDSKDKTADKEPEAPARKERTSGSQTTNEEIIELEQDIFTELNIEKLE